VLTNKVYGLHFRAAVGACGSWCSHLLSSMIWAGYLKKAARFGG
jgi:hypothetical protein